MNIYSLFYRPNKPEGIEKRKAHIVGGGIAGLAAATFLIDDAGMPGENITIYEKRNGMGGCCGIIGNEGAYVCPGERELEPHMECLWYLCSKIPSLDSPGRSVLDETVDANRESAIHSECRCILKQGHIWEDVHDYRMDPATSAQLQKFLTQPEENPEDMTMEEYFGKDSPFFESAMWWCFHPMLAFKPHHSALEAKRYLARFGLANRIDYLDGILHTKRNEYDSIIKPMMVWLEEKGVHFQYGYGVYDLDMDEECNTVYGIRARKDGKEVQIPGDVVFTIETSVRTPLQAVYQLTGLKKEPIEVYPSEYDMRYFLERMKKFAGIDRPVTEQDLPRINPLKIHEMKKELIQKINSIPPYYTMYQGKDQSVAHKKSVLNPEFPKSK